MGMLGHQARAGATEAPQVPEVDQMAQDVQALELELNVAELAAEDTGTLMAYILNFTLSDQALGRC